MWRESEVFRWRVVLTAVLAVLVWYLVAGTPPWDEKLQGRIAERDATGDFWRSKDYGLYFGWWAALGNAGALALLVATAGWWAKGRREGAAQGAQVPVGRGEGVLMTRGIFLVLLGLITGVAIYERAPRLHHSFWNDEEYGFRKYTVGEYRTGKDGELEFRRLGWDETLFRNRLNNHILQTVAARISHGVWETSIKAEDGPLFREWVIRAFPLACGIGSILAAGLFLGMLGHRVAGLGAAFYLALAPWHMRFSVEARGYSSAMFFGLLAVVFAYLALRDGRWRNWLLFGLCEALVLLSNFGYAPVLLVLNVGLMALWAMRGAGEPLYGERAVLAKRWAVANVLAAAAVVQVALPSVPQIRMMLEGGLGLTGSMDWTWWREVWTQLAAGVDWAVSDQSTHHATSAEVEMGRSALFSLWVFGIFPALGLAGLVRSAARHRYVFLAGLTTVGGAVLTWWTNESREFFLHSWYVNFALMGMAIYFGMGCGWVVTAMARCGWLAGRMGRVSGMAVVAVCLGVYAVGTATGRGAIRNHDRQPAKGAIALIRGEAPAPMVEEGAPMVAAFGAAFTTASSYQPEHIYLNSLAMLEETMGDARAGGRDLYVLMCGRQLALRNETTRTMLELCEDEAVFERFGFLKGMEEMYSYRVFKLRR